MYKQPKTLKESGTNPYLAQLTYHNTPTNEVLGLPSQRLFRRRTKTTLPTLSTLLQLIREQLKKQPEKKKKKQKQNFDQHTKQLPDLQPGDKVRYGTNRGLKPPVVIEKRMIRTSNGLVLRRNRRHLYNSTDSNQLSDCNLDDDSASEDQPHSKYQLPWVHSRMMDMFKKHHHIEYDIKPNKYRAHHHHHLTFAASKAITNGLLVAQPIKILDLQ